MINRKAQGTIWKMVAIIIGVFILVFIAIFLIGCTKNQCGEFWKIIIPGLNQGTPDKVEGAQVIGYRPEMGTNGAVYFWNGAWNELTKKVTLDEKEIDTSVLNSFVNYYFVNRKVGSFTSKDSQGNGLQASFTFKKNFAVVPVSAIFIHNEKLYWPVVIRFMDSNNKENILFLTNDNKYYTYNSNSGEAVSVRSLDAKFNPYIDAAKVWRDSILQGNSDAKAIEITYHDNLINSDMTKKYCVEKSAPYLVVHLDSPVLEDKECQ